ncbi:MAG: stage V sporulation protein AA [Clostridiales bacterium]|nr:stage V sporulation protein AA [Clostridiales bacterium]
MTNESGDTVNIYIKPQKKVNITGPGAVKIKDIADVCAEGGLKEQVENLKLITLDGDRKKNYLVSVLDIAEKINSALPGQTVNNLGESDIVIEYSPKEKKQNSFFLWSKVFFVSIVLLAGSATAIMSFHSDAQISTVFENYYYIFFNEKIENPMLIDLPYSIGLALGIIAFFNHFSGKKITDDPTPIEVEMSVYESEVTDNIIDTLNKKGGGKP